MKYVEYKKILWVLVFRSNSQALQCFTLCLVEQKTKGKENFRRKVGEENCFPLLGLTKESAQKRKCTEKVGVGPTKKFSAPNRAENEWKTPFYYAYPFANKPSFLLFLLSSVKLIATSRYFSPARWFQQVVVICYLVLIGTMFPFFIYIYIYFFYFSFLQIFNRG